MLKLNSFTRLFDLKNKNESAGLDMVIEKSMMKTGRPQVITSFNLFQTPPEVVALMLNYVDVRGRRVLEPSAGLGAIISRLGPASEVTAIDISKPCIKYLYGNFQNIKLIEGDFLKIELPQIFDIAVMNPPFKNGVDIKHILKAVSICDEVVFLCYDGPRQNKILKPMCEVWEKLPAKSFKKAGTNANVCLGVIRK